MEIACPIQKPYVVKDLLHKANPIIWVCDKKRTHLYILIAGSAYKKGKLRDYVFSHKPDSIISIPSSFLYIFLSIQCCWDWLRFHNSVLMVFTSQWHQDYAKIKMAQTMFPSLVDAWQWEYMISFKENCVIDQMRWKQKTKKISV